MNEEPLKIISSMATRSVLAELASRYADAKGRAVRPEAGGGVDVAKRVRAGEPFDVVALASDVIDQLIGEGHLTGPRIDIVKSATAIAVRAGAPRVDIGSEAAVRDAVSAARSLSYSTGPSGRYLEGLFERWGLLDDLVATEAPGQARVTFRHGVDVRGEIGTTLKESDCYAIGRTFGSVVVRGGGTSVVLGYDGRETSPVFAESVIAGLQKSGLDVHVVGLGPSPMVYFALHHLHADASVVVTGASSDAPRGVLVLIVAKVAPVERRALLAPAATWKRGVPTLFLVAAPLSLAVKFWSSQDSVLLTGGLFATLAIWAVLRAGTSR